MKWYQRFELAKKIIPVQTGLEPARVKPIGTCTRRLNHSATTPFTFVHYPKSGTTPGHISARL
ncbi:hypothetical protein HYPBUDRAFT_153144 [Hyphopichia burtonii NRRL Y-1933]|uniref:Uncharacterized protein n=1 Tax=Hyphopichia burtonii NRRL Y-1933 TaxID=984485 RepID=A0A1E4RJ54_9ASCO|nr:hypothetical protein HYPBUDRAFT_153144 [Hyphopichia burtonii NRRL Y-1933]ODV67297.1 hypothetical protein HYPBUDRAFT_153144 [Hyphopichia burtonii NRRL Y-1933]